MVKLIDSDIICLDSVESYLQRMNVPYPRTPEEKLALTQVGRDQLYSDIANRLPRVAAYLLQVADPENDDKAKGLSRAISHHCMDAAFVSIVMQKLRAEGFIDDCHIIGALFVTVADQYMVKNKPDEKLKSEEKEEVLKKMARAVQHLYDASRILLRDIIEDVSNMCPGLSETDRIAVAAALSVNNENTLKELLSFNGAITADIFEIYNDPNEIIKNALLLKKADYTKLTPNQKAFIDSLTTFVFKKLDSLDMSNCYRFLTSTYQSLNPDTKKYLICITDVSVSAYPNLHEVVKQFKS